MAMQEKQLGQLRPSTTTPTSIYNPPASTTGVVRTIHIVNPAAGNRTYKIYHDADGTTYDATTIIHQGSISGNSSLEINTFIAASNSAGNIAVETSSGTTLNFTLYGAEIT